jgi:hypothetical protein
MALTALDGEVRGTAVRTILQAIDEACGFFDGRTQEHLAARGLADASAQSWYDVRDYAAVYDDLLDSTGKHTVRRIGKELAHRMTFDRDPETLGEALAALDDSYRHLHRGDVGGYRFESTGTESGRLVCHTPYPAPLERGLVRGLAQRFTDTGFISTELVNTDRQDAFHTTTFDLEWWEGTGIQTGENGVEAGASSGLTSAD